MILQHWLEKPRTLAVLTLAFALVPAAVAFFTFRAVRERDGKLFGTASEVLGEQLNLATFRQVSFLNVMRHQWRSVTDYGNPPRFALPPAGWEDRMPHLRCVAFAESVDPSHAMVRWMDGKIPVVRPGENLAAGDAFRAAFDQARQTSAPIAIGIRPAPATLAIVEAVADMADNSSVRGFLVLWVDLVSVCRDPELPLIRNQSLFAGLERAAGAREAAVGEGRVRWTAWISRGPGFSREYGTPTPWIGFVAIGLSALPLSILVVVASRAGKLRAALETEREIVRLKTHFLHSVSHDFRTPLSVIQSAADLLENYAGQLAPERRSKALRQIHESTRAMNEMVEQVLTLSRLESRQMPVRPGRIALRDMISASAASAGAAAGDRCPIEVEGDPGLQVIADENLLRCAIGNLMGNAVKHSDPGSPVVVSLDSGGGVVIVRVIDRGSGIAPEELPRVREPFFRGSNSAGLPGTGLGLALVSRCVELLGGEWSVASVPGQGTTVELRLPAP